MYFFKFNGNCENILVGDSVVLIGTKSIIMKTVFKKIGLCIVLMSLFFSCQKKELIGDEIISTSDSFSIDGFSFSKEEVDFTNGYVFFDGKFSEEVTAKIELTGQKSGATKSFSYQLCTRLDQSNAEWNGEHDGLIFFQDNEDVIAKLSFYGHKMSYYDTIKISKVTDYSYDKNVFFYRGAGVEEPLTWMSWASKPYGEGLDKTLFGRSDFVKPVQGSYSYRLVSKSAQKKGYLGGGDFNVKASQGGFVHLSDQAEDVWFNCFVYSTKKSSGNIIISFTEADNDAQQSSSLKTDKVNLVIPIDFEGWKLVACRYKDIPFATNPLFGGNGNKVHEPNKIEFVSFQTESTKDNEMIDVAFDAFTFTVVKPFQ